VVHLQFVRGPRFIPTIEALFAVLFWGASFIATKIALRDLQPLTVVWVRFALGTLVLLIVITARRQFALPSKKDLQYFAFLGFIGVTLHNWIQATALQTAQATTTSWIIAATPIFIAIFAFIMLKESPGWARTAGIGMAALGVLLVVSKGNIGALLSGKAFTKGDLLVMLNPPNWALFTVLSRKGLKDHPPARMMFYVMTLGWLFTFPLFLWGPGVSDLSHFTLNSVLAIAFLGILCSGLGYIFWYDALKVMPAAQVGVFQYIQPLVTVIVAGLILDEPLLLSSLFGGAVILAGVWMVQRPSIKTSRGIHPSEEADMM
jgi:drug/metabolite transporter (DMT)-like permease